jgi:peptide/nickel transport system permease protein
MSKDVKQRFGDYFTKVRRTPLLPAFILLATVICAIFAPGLSPLDPNEIVAEDTVLPPVWMEGGKSSHILGTDDLGRDILSRMIWGARISLVIAATAVFVGAGIGSVLGIVSGYFGGGIDTIIMRAADTMLSLPYMLIALVVVSVVGPSLMNIILIISALRWAGFARMIRGETLALREQSFIDLARVAGTRPFVILAVHIFPNVLNTIVVLITLGVGQVILFEAALSFLGVGVPPPTSTWGSMVADGRAFISSAWWIAFFPGLAITVFCLAGNLFGDWLREALDPKLRQI